VKLERKVGDFATAASAAQLTLKGGVVERAGIGLTNAGPVPAKAVQAERFLEGQEARRRHDRRGGAPRRPERRAEADRRGSVEYKKEMARVLTARALARAAERAGGA
jgi:carbon-monoxide dehydrogenase medium subunit